MPSQHALHGARCAGDKALQHCAAWVFKKNMQQQKAQGKGV